MKKLFAIMLVLVTTLGAAAQDRTRAVYNVSPNMNCQNCVNKVSKALGAIQGVDSVVPDLGSQTVLVVYDAKTLKPEILVNAMSEIGYTITPANEVARPMISPKVTRLTTAAATSAATVTTATAASSEVVPSGAAAEKFQQIENANPGIVTAVDGQPVQQATGHCAKEGQNACSREAQECNNGQATGHCAKEGQEACSREAQECNNGQATGHCAKEGQNACSREAQECNNGQATGHCAKEGQKAGKKEGKKGKKAKTPKGKKK